jgi:hypothetical protein
VEHTAGPGLTLLTSLQVTEGGREPGVFFELDFNSFNMSETMMFLGFMFLATVVTALIAKGISYR